MKTISIKLSDAQYTAFTSATFDVEAHMVGIAEGLANKAADKIIASEQARVLGTDEQLPADLDQIVLNAFTNGHVKTVAERNAEAEAAATIGERPTTDPEEVQRQTVLAHALALKVGMVNSTRTDGEADPVTVEGLSAIEARYSRYIAAFLTDKELGVDVSDRLDTVRLIRAGETYFEAVNAAAKTIIDAGDAADPVASDGRWPDLPTAS
jgi:hypothetical protein